LDIFDEFCQAIIGELFNFLHQVHSQVRGDLVRDLDLVLSVKGIKLGMFALLS
jgi:hypothetical protein